MHNDCSPQVSSCKGYKSDIKCMASIFQAQAIYRSTKAGHSMYNICMCVCLGYNKHLHQDIVCTIYVCVSVWGTINIYTGGNTWWDSIMRLSQTVRLSLSTCMHVGSCACCSQHSSKCQEACILEGSGWPHVSCLQLQQVTRDVHHTEHDSWKW